MKILKQIKEHFDNENMNQPHIQDKIKRYLQTILSVEKKKTEEISVSRPDNFLTRIGSDQLDGYDKIPPNCLHAKICYFIWAQEGNLGKDPTEIGRRIKKANTYRNN